MKFFEKLNSKINVFCNKNLGSSQRYTGFTLAEVLITLGIIGVVAALTIPTLLNNIKDQEYRTGWKKAYTVLMQASNVIKAEGNDFSGYTSIDDLRDAFAAKLKVIKSCDNSQITNCWHATGTWKHLAGSSAGNPWPCSAIVLADGTLVAFSPPHPDCDLNNVWTPSGGICSEFYVDTNGFKPPNVMGKDIFGIWLQKDALTVYGTKNDFFAQHPVCSYSNPAAADNIGGYCAHLFLTGGVPD